jgi:hypothetical protein
MKEIPGTRRTAREKTTPILIMIMMRINPIMPIMRKLQTEQATITDMKPGVRTKAVPIEKPEIAAVMHHQAMEKAPAPDKMKICRPEIQVKPDALQPMNNPKSKLNLKFTFGSLDLISN